jgi:N-acetyl-1-D-myo-inositol-2-amino-2-deoxy-alpha-D-glucopyranoside deacetylase
MSAAEDSAAPSLLAVFAHPDDESIACGGLIARCADLGVHVTLLCATRGENRSGVRDEHLLELRPRELSEAARVLGASDVILLDYRDGFLPWADDLQARLEAEIRRLRPAVVITFGNDGLYWHPDHVALHERTTAAVKALGSAAPALYYVTMPPGAMRRIAEAVGGGDPAAADPLFGTNPDAFGLHAAAPTLVVDTRPTAARKLAALRCHRTQVSTQLSRLTDEQAANLFPFEHLHRAPSSRPSFLETLPGLQFPCT